MNRRNRFPGKPFIFMLVIATIVSCTGGDKKTNPNDKVEALIRQMTLEEKIGQMTQICFSMITEGRSKNLVVDMDAARDAILNYHVGSFLSGTGSEQEWASFITELQTIAVEETRLGIPLIIGIDHIHGANYVNEGVIFPHNITLSCSFNKDLIQETAEATANQTGRLGLHWNFAPVLGIAKNPYWPRFYETYGEDPWVSSVMGSAFVHAYQLNLSKKFNLAACAKHYIGYSDPVSGWDRTPAEIPVQTLREQFLPPFMACIDSGVKSIMLNSGEVNGVPVHISKPLVKELLRKELEYDGVIVTDIKDILKVVQMHAAAATEKEATQLALETGIDVSMACDAFRFPGIVKELVSEGRISEERINRSVRRILQLKYNLGLFDNPYPLIREIKKPNSEKLYELSVRAAEESIVLLKNKGLLPLKRNARILLTGFAADSKRNMNGAWTLEWLGAEEERQPQMMPTLKEALANQFPNVNYVITPDFETGKNVEQFQSALQSAEVVILTIGETPYSEFKGNITDLNLNDQQRKLCEMAIHSKKPVLILLIEGRPRLITGIEEDVQAVLFAGYPGMGGPEGIANILSGKTNPSGKLSFTYPSTSGHHTVYYHKPSEMYQFLYPFGHGLSYTRFDYSEIFISDTLVNSLDQSLKFSFDVTNAGLHQGRETVLIFMQDKVGAITRPVRRLVHFEKIILQPDETRSIEIELFPKQIFSYPDARGNTIIEDGEFVFMIKNRKFEVWLDRK